MKNTNDTDVKNSVVPPKSQAEVFASLSLPIKILQLFERILASLFFSSLLSVFIFTLLSAFFNWDTVALLIAIVVFFVTVRFVWLKYKYVDEETMKKNRAKANGIDDWTPGDTNNPRNPAPQTPIKKFPKINQNYNSQGTNHEGHQPEAIG